MSQYLRTWLPWIAASALFAVAAALALLTIAGGAPAAPFIYTIF